MGAILRDLERDVVWHLDRGDAWIVGRGPGCDVVIADPSAAPRHLRIEFASGGWRVSTLFSAAEGATAVNGISTEREELRPGDVLRMGTTRLAFEVDERPPAADAGGKPAQRREPIALPQSFEALVTLFTAPTPSVDAALVAARAGEALLRFCEIAERRPPLREIFQAGLASSWPVLRAVSAHGLAATAAGEPAAGAAIAPLVDHPDRTVRSAAARALATVDPVAAAPRLHARAVAALTDARFPSEAAEYAAQLCEIGTESLLADLASRARSQALDAGEPVARAAAAAVLGELAAAGLASARRPLRTLLSDAVEDVRLAAVNALRRSVADGDARDALRMAIADPAARVFQATARALAGTNDPLLAELLVKALRATDATDLERRARYRRALEDVTGERRGPDPDAWLE